MVKGIRGSASSSAQRIFCSFLCKMTTPSTLPVKEQDGVELRKTGDHVSDGGTDDWAVVLCSNDRKGSAQGRSK